MLLLACAACADPPADLVAFSPSALDAGQLDSLDAGPRAPIEEPARDGALGPVDVSTPAAGVARAEDLAHEATCAADPGVVAAGVRWIGRVDLSDPSAPRFSWPGTGFAARFHGTGLHAALGEGSAVRFKAVVDGVPQATFVAAGGVQALARGLVFGEHTLTLYRQSEGNAGDSLLSGLRVDDGALLPPPPAPARSIELIGDSVSVGGGALGTPADEDCDATQSHWDSYGAVAARALDAELSTVAASGHGVYRDYSGAMGLLLPRLYEHALTYSETSPWGFVPQPQAVVINLGTNDVGLSETDPGPAFRDAYRQLVRTVRGKYPNARIVGAIGPMLGGDMLAAMRGHIAAVMDALRAEGDARVSAFLGFEHQADDQVGCGGHPNAAAHALMGQQLAAELRRLLGW